MTLTEAVDLVARAILADRGPGRRERTVPLMSDDDFAAVMRRVTELAPYPDRDAYDEARTFLAARAEGT